MSKIYETKVTSVGPNAADFLSEGMIILFGEEAPEMLADFCYNIVRNEIVGGNIVAGGTLKIDNQEFVITAVGNVVEQNLVTLGHITVKFDGADNAELPGALHVKATGDITIGENSVIEIFA
ncbi:MAG: PTS glucitol/sorbitol transporter subunit IIA [Streptococcaceae bacterium]|jgi:PTS system glucitol/sorbitol-specific IIA component|nr:PTS glucitol/sorbitol transporter subunit IIA [Streptococcaceae bacterium]